ncbi:hypothetical protein M758_2G211500 [Ceratodon purpureus]|nr:hypothetical protein M758_2G211500 [Ceratodon purpureus]
MFVAVSRLSSSHVESVAWMMSGFQFQGFWFWVRVWWYAGCESLCFHLFVSSCSVMVFLGFSLVSLLQEWWSSARMGFVGFVFWIACVGSLEIRSVLLGKRNHWSAWCAYS